MRNTRKVRGCIASNLIHTRDEMEGNTSRHHPAEEAIAGYLFETDSKIGESSMMAENPNRVPECGTVFCQREMTYEDITNKLTSDKNYATNLKSSQTVVLSSCEERQGRCKTCTEQQALNCVSITSSTNIFESIFNDNRHRRTLHVRHITPAWMKAFALLFIICLTSCNAMPTNPSSKPKSAVVPPLPASESDPAARLHNGTRHVRHGRSSDFFQHVGEQRLYNNEVGLFLEVKRSGKVAATSDVNSQYSNLRVLSIERGVMALHYTKAGRFLCMSPKKRGKLYTSIAYDDDCAFKEVIDNARGYFYYQPASTPKGRKGRKHKKERYLAVRAKKSKRGRGKRGRAMTSFKYNKTCRFTKISKTETP